MFLFKLALGNLKHNLKRTVALALIISVATMSIILYKGYVEYSREGMALGYISSSGDFQIATEKYWNGGAENFLTPEQNMMVSKKLESMEYIDHFDKVIDFSGIIGNENNSAIFWGKGYDFPEKHFSATEGFSIFSDDDGILVGNILAEKLGYGKFKDGIFLTIMTTSPESGLCLSSAEFSGITSTGILENDSGLLVTTRKSALDFLEMEDESSFVQVYMNDRKKRLETISDLELFFTQNGLPLSVKTWEDLNPSFAQVNALNDFQFYVISIILCLLIFISLMQSVSTSFIERLGEFGMLEAIGLKKRKIAFMLILEVFYLAVLGILIGVGLSYVGNSIVQKFGITMTPPGYTEGFQLFFYFTTKSVIASGTFILGTCVFAVLIPVIPIYKNSAAKLITKS